MISLIIPTYRNPDYLDICLKSAIEQQDNENEILVAVDGFIEESHDILNKYGNKIKVLDLGENKGMQTALNLAVYNASNEKICIINDDNVLCKGWDTIIEKQLKPDMVLTINQIEPTGPGIFDFPVKDFGKDPNSFQYQKFIDYELQLRSKHKITPNGGIFPFAMWKKDYMIVGGFDTIYDSPFICDWDFFLKLDLNKIILVRTHAGHFYHFGSTATKNGKEGERFKATEGPAAGIFMYKWGIPPSLYENLSHNPKNGKVIKGIKYE
jgi:glycosyltransferase involved in cell wall biosynthesis|tara:strand:- start:769 stop:1569 length:801 start_codon:yes stop_codon:yes gene_type:complete